MAKIHPINRYCKTTKLSHAQFARLIGVSRTHVWHMSTTGEVGRKTAALIVKATKGKITYEALFSWKPPKEAGA